MDEMATRKKKRKLFNELRLQYRGMKEEKLL